MQRLRLQNTLTGGSPIIRPSRQAAILAGVYFVVSAVYIVASDYWAETAADRAYTFTSVQTMKGLGFVAVTAMGIFALAFAMLQGMRRREDDLRSFRKALLAAERRAAASLMGAALAHDVNNVLMIVSEVARQLRQAPDLPGDLRGMAEVLNDAQVKLRALAEKMRDTANPDSGSSAVDCDLAAELRTTARLLRQHEKLRYCDFDVQAPENLSFHGHPGLVHQMLVNLVLNAADATNGRGTVRVHLRDGEEEGCTIEVHDNGPGVSPEEREHILEPFFTTKEDGSGLGLLSVTACTSAHAGSLEIGESDLGGACFRVRLKSQSG